MFNRRMSAAAVSTVVLLALDPLAAFAAPAAAAPATPAVSAAPQTITRDGVSITYERVTIAYAPKTGTGETRSDYDGDGLDDIAAASRGGVIVRYSSQRWIDYFGTVNGGSRLRLGTALASGDFNGDGYDDLAMGDPEELDRATGTSSGGVWIVPGSAQGLSAGAIRHLNQGSPGVPQTSTPGDDFAGALAAGDITGDGRADLAVGVPGKDIGDAASAGGLVMFLSNAGGVSTTGARWLDQNSDYMPDTAEDWDRFGGTLAIGGFNGDATGDLIVCSPGENTKGLLNVILGVKTGLNVIGVPSIYGADVEARAPGVGIIRLGYGGVAMADTDGEGRQDIVIGVPEATVDGHVSAGAAVVVDGAYDASFDRIQVITQNTADVPGTAGDYDGFGSSVAAGDLSGDGFAELIIGVPNEDVVDAPTAPPGTIANAGVITILAGSPAGPTAQGSVERSQGYEYTPGTSETDDRFGHAVRILNLDNRPGLDAIVSASGERAVDEGGPSTPGGDTPGSITTHSGSSLYFMYGVSRTTGRDLTRPGFNTNIYGYVL